jgi:hypothetical protein
MYKQVFIPSIENHTIAIPSKWYGCEVEIVVSPKSGKPRSTWAAAARQMHLAGGDKALLPSLHDENIDWWTWDE